MMCLCGDGAAVITSRVEILFNFHDLRNLNISQFAEGLYCTWTENWYKFNLLFIVIFLILLGRNAAIFFFNNINIILLSDYNNLLKKVKIKVVSTNLLDRSYNISNIEIQILYLTFYVLLYISPITIHHVFIFFPYKTTKDFVNKCI